MMAATAIATAQSSAGRFFHFSLQPQNVAAGARRNRGNTADLSIGSNWTEQEKQHASRSPTRHIACKRGSS